MLTPELLHLTHAPTAEQLAALRALLPGWELRVWEPIALEAFVVEHYASFVPLLGSVETPARALLQRLLLVAHFGGVSLAERVELRRPLSPWLRSIDSSSALSTRHRLDGDRRGSEPCDAFLAAVPQAPLLAALVDELASLPAEAESGARVLSLFSALSEARARELGAELLAPDVGSPLSLWSAAKSDRERRYVRLMHQHGAYPTATVAVDLRELPAPEPRLTRWSRGVRRALVGETTLDELVRPARYALRLPETAFPPRKSRRADHRRRVVAGRAVAETATLAVCVALYNRPDLALLLRLRLATLIPHFKAVHVHVLGEDSTDETRQVLREWASAEPATVRSVPVPELPKPVFAKMAALRNALLRSVEAGPAPDYLLMLDGDLEGPFSHHGLFHALSLLEDRPRCGAVSAFGVNNRFLIDRLLPVFGYSYYDPLAFRELAWERERSDAAIRLRLFGVEVGDPPIAVKSAFGGAAVYRASAVRGVRYPAEPDDCEHVGFHRALAERGHELLVDPAFVLLAGVQGHHAQSK